MKRGEFTMPTKFLKKDETLAANSLRSLSQKSLMEMVTDNEKLGLIVNNDLSIAMLSWENYEKLVDLIEVQNKKIQEMEHLLEDIDLAEIYGEDIIKSEEGKSNAYKVKDVDELFGLLQDRK
ncbi:hypothetical protein [Virgibacillus sp. CBA3643]|uniref:hypothetical protein n=1 Tax=Virgibacillus sp. CBA3643 TaxID=2942278 RepID=UPI0035A29D27